MVSARAKGTLHSVTMLCHVAYRVLFRRHLTTDTIVLHGILLYRFIALELKHGLMVPDMRVSTKTIDATVKGRIGMPMGGAIVENIRMIGPMVKASKRILMVAFCVTASGIWENSSTVDLFSSNPF